MITLLYTDKEVTHCCTLLNSLVQTEDVGGESRKFKLISSIHLLLLLAWLVSSSGVAGVADDGIPQCCPVCRVVLLRPTFAMSLIGPTCNFPS